MDNATGMDFRRVSAHVGSERRLNGQRQNRASKRPAESKGRFHGPFLLQQANAVGKPVCGCLIQKTSPVAS
jgi:hypothetical protein